MAPERLDMLDAHSDGTEGRSLAEERLSDVLGEGAAGLYRKASERTLLGYHLGPLDAGYGRDVLDDLGVLDRRLPGVYKVLEDDAEVVRRLDYLEAEREVVARSFEGAKGMLERYFSKNAPQYLPHVADLSLDEVDVRLDRRDTNGSWDGPTGRLMVKDHLGGFDTLPSGGDVVPDGYYNGFSRDAILQTTIVHEAIHRLHDRIREADWPLRPDDGLSYSPYRELREGFALAMEEEVVMAEGTAEMRHLVRDRMRRLAGDGVPEYWRGHRRFGEVRRERGLDGVFDEAVRGR